MQYSINKCKIKSQPQIQIQSQIITKNGLKLKLHLKFVSIFNLYCRRFKLLEIRLVTQIIHLKS